MSGFHVPPPDSGRNPDDAAPSALLSVVDVLDDAMLVVSADGLIAHINPAASRLLGVARDAAVGLPHERVCPLVDALAGTRLPSLVSAALARGGRVDPPVEVALESGPGQSPIDVDAAAVRVDAGGSRAAVLVLRPLADRRHLQEAARTAEAQRQGLARTVIDTVHDINNALAPVVLTLGGFREDGAVDVGLLDGMARRLEDAIETVRRLRDAVGTKPRRRAAVDGGDVLSRLAAVLRSTCAPELEVLLHIEEGLPPVNVDAVLLHASLFKLAHRARVALASGGRLRLSASRAGNHVCFSIEDTGASLQSAPLVQRVLTAADRMPLDPPLEELRAVAGALLVDGGFLRVTSVPGRGTRVEVHVDVSIAAAADRPVEAAAFRGHGETVLFVDDEAPVRAAAAATLSRLGLVAVLAADGDEAMRMVASYGARIDLVITDVNMPNTDGLALVRALREVLPGVPLVLSSGHFDHQVASSAFALGIAQLLEKPFTEARLAQCLVMTLGRGRSAPAAADIQLVPEE